MISVKIFSWASTCWGTPKQSPKTYSATRKTPRYRQNRATNYDFRQNHFLGIDVSTQTEIVPKKVLRGSKNPQVRSKPSLKLWFLSKSPGHQHVEAHRNSSWKRTQRVEKTPIRSKPSYKLWFTWKSSPGHQRVQAHRNSPQKRTQLVGKPGGTVKTELQTMISVKIFLWALTCQSTPK